MTSNLSDLLQNQKVILTNNLSRETPNSSTVSLQGKLFVRSKQILKKISSSKTSKRNSIVLSPNEKSGNILIQERGTDIQPVYFDNNFLQPKTTTNTHPIMLLEKINQEKQILTKSFQPQEEAFQEKYRIDKRNKITTYESLNVQEKDSWILQKSNHCSGEFSPKLYNRYTNQSRSALDFSIKPIEKQISFSKQLDEKLSSYVWNAKPELNFSLSRQEISRSMKRRSPVKASNYAVDYISRVGLETKKGSVDSYVDFSKYIKNNIRNNSMNLHRNAVSEINPYQEKTISRSQNRQKINFQEDNQDKKTASLEVLDKTFGLKDSISTVLSSPSNKFPLMKKKMIKKPVFLLYSIVYYSRFFPMKPLRKNLCNPFKTSF